MKICPVCRTNYPDNENFCLNDGTPLAAEPQQVEPLEPNTVVQPRESETIVHTAPITNLSGGQTNLGQNPPPIVVVEKKANTGKIVALSALTTILLVAIIGGGGYLIWQNNNRQIAQTNANNSNVVKPKNSNSANNNAANSNIANTNANISNVNSNTNASPSPKPTLSAEQTKKIRQDVSDALDGWAASTENRNLESHLAFYAATVEFYNGDSARLRADRQKAFETWNDISVDLSNVKITPDASGDKAVAVIDKEWNFENDAQTSSGKAQQQLTLEKIGGRWQITAEKDLKVYYTDKY